MIRHKLKNIVGFTLIEMIVSLGVFSVVVTTSVGAMLVLIKTNQQLQSEQNIMTNIAFALDAMTREIRTGYNYYCLVGTDPTSLNQEDWEDDDRQDCASGRTGADFIGISFFEGGDSITGASNERIMYFYDEAGNTLKRVVGNGTPQSILPSGLVIVDADFFVTGSDNLLDDGDEEQPTVTIFVAAESATNPGKTYSLQTTVTQRALDL